jgi:hypothetical protein
LRDRAPGLRWRVLVLVGLAGCSDKTRPLPSTADQGHPREEHAVLAGSFASRDSAALGSLLHAELVVQPPAPDSALRGAPARSYLTALAANTSVSASRLYPQTVVPEGQFAFEQGIWVLQVGDLGYQSPYMLRWRRTPAGWRVVLWRWERFR